MSKAPHCSPLLCRHLLYFTPAVVYFKAQRIAVIKLQDTIYAPVCPGVHSLGWGAIFWPVSPGRGNFCWQCCSAIHWQCGGHRHPKAVRQMQQLTKKLSCCWDVKEMFNTKLSTEVNLRSPEWQVLNKTQEISASLTISLFPQVKILQSLSSTMMLRAVGFWGQQRSQ